MGVITAVETQQRDESRVNIYIDGKFALGVTALLAISNGLRPGREIEAAEIQELDRADRVERAYSASLNFLSYRPRSTREVEDYFRRKGTEADVVDDVVGRLQRAGFLNDAEFARFWVENRQTFRPRGSRALRMEMRQKGLDSNIIDEALLEAGEEEQRAYEAGKSKSRAYGSLEEREFFRKMMGFLQRRGFPFEPASAATRRLYAELSSGVEDDPRL